MILYHGTNKKFTQFKIGAEYARCHEIDLVEGYGVYLASNSELSKSYGSYLYTIEVDDTLISDYTDEAYIYELFFQIQKDLNFDLSILGEDQISELVDSILTGFSSVTGLGKEICDRLDSLEVFYVLYQDRLDYSENDLTCQIKQWFEEHNRPVLKYYDKNFLEDIYLCTKNPEVLKIIDIQTI